MSGADYFAKHHITESILYYYRYDEKANTLCIIHDYVDFVMMKTREQAQRDRDCEFHKLVFRGIKRLSRKVIAIPYRGIEIYDAEKGMGGNAIYDVHYSKFDGLHRFQAQLTNFGKLDILFADLEVEKRRLKYDKRKSENDPIVYRDVATGKIVEGLHAFKV